jgi:hypothetical protein
MKTNLPKSLITAINRLSSEEVRKQVWARSQSLRAEYSKRLAAGESIDALEREVSNRTCKAMMQMSVVGGK